MVISTKATATVLISYDKEKGSEMHSETSKRIREVQRKGRELARQMGIKSAYSTGNQQEFGLPKQKSKKRRKTFSASFHTSTQADDPISIHEYSERDTSQWGEEEGRGSWGAGGDGDYESIIPRAEPIGLADFEIPEVSESLRSEISEIGSGFAGSEEPDSNLRVGSGGGISESLGNDFSDDYEDVPRCPLCDDFSPDSDSHVIRSMWDLFWSNFWERSLEHLAKMLHQMWQKDIYLPEVMFNNNQRQLPAYSWHDFYQHFISPSCMGCHPMIVIRKLIEETRESLEMQRRQSYSVDGLDYRAIEGARRDRKFLLDLYSVTPENMLGYSDRCKTGGTQGFGGFVRGKGGK